MALEYLIDCHPCGFHRILANKQSAVALLHE
jgi:hypothetical protein